MGANLVYLPRPNKKKITEEGRNQAYRYVVSSMQGWRLNMEDAHICNPDLDSKEEDFAGKTIGGGSSMGGGTMSTMTFGSTSSSSHSSGLKIDATGAHSALPKQVSLQQPSQHAMQTLSGGAGVTIPSSGGSNGLFCIFDGHGGIEVAEFCSRHFEDTLKSNPHYQSMNYELALQETFLKMDEFLQTPEGKAEIVEISKLFPAQVSQLEKALVASGNLKDTENSSPQDMIDNKGCTANVVLIKDGTIYVANAGDARCVAAIGGKAVPLSNDHKPTLSREKQRVIKAGFSVNGEGRIDGNLNLSRSIGDLKYKKNKKLRPHEQAITAFPEVKAITYQGAPGKKVDFLVIGCDGVWEMKNSQQIVTQIYEQKKKKVPLKKTCETMLDSLLSPNIQRTMGKGCDNMTMIIVDFQQ